MKNQIQKLHQVLLFLIANMMQKVHAYSKMTAIYPIDIKKN